VSSLVNIQNWSGTHKPKGLAEHFFLAITSGTYVKFVKFGDHIDGAQISPWRPKVDIFQKPKRKTNALSTLQVDLK